MTTPKRIISGSQLAGSLATYYTAPANTRCIIKKLTFCNKTGAAVAVDVHLVPSGGSAGDTNAIWAAKIVADDETRECFEVENHVLEAGGFIQALGLNVDIVGSGVEIT